MRFATEKPPDRMVRLWWLYFSRIPVRLERVRDKRCMYVDLRQYTAEGDTYLFHPRVRRCELFIDPECTKPFTKQMAMLLREQP